MESRSRMLRLAARVQCHWRN